MKTSPRALAVALFSCLALSATTRPAGACGAPICYGRTTYLLPQDGQSVPASAPGLPMFVGFNAGPLAVTLTKVSGGARTPMTMGRTSLSDRFELVTATDGLEAGATYELSASGGEGTCALTSTSTFTVTPPAPRPRSLGALSLTAGGPTKLGLDSGASCSREVLVAQAAVEVALSAEAAPWASLLRYETLVDGKPWHARSTAGMQVHPAGGWKGVGRDVIYATCAPEKEVFAGVSLGRHEVVIRALLPGAPEVALESSPITIGLACGAGDAGDAGGGGDAGGPAPGAAQADPVGTATVGGCASTPLRGGGGSAASLVLVALGLCARARRRGREA